MALMDKSGKQRNRVPRATPTSAARWQALSRWAAPAAIVLTAIAMMCWTWGTWPDVIVDFGRELYAPWRLSEGEVLYRDLAYFNGPLSPYVNSVWFRMFGPSLRVLALANFALLGAIAALIYALLLQLGSRVSALLACMTFLLVFGFSRYTIAGNYNYICPYSHEMTHGLLLALAAMVFVGRFVRGGKVMNAALSGFCVGLVLLTKPEIFAAVLPATLLGVALAFWSQDRKATRIGPVAAAFLAPIFAPAVAAAALLSLAMPAAEAIAATLGGFRWMLVSEITSLRFYRLTMGTQYLAENVQELLVMIFWYAVLLGLPAGLGFLQWRTRAGQWAAGGACFAAVAFGLLWNFKKIPATDVLRPVPVVMLAMLFAAAVLWHRHRDSSARARLVLPIALLLFALLLLAKVIFWVRVTHYSFVLAVPAAMLLIVVAWDWASRAVEHFAGSSFMLRGAFLATLIVVVMRCLSLANVALATLNVPVGTGADAFWADARGEEVNRILSELADRASPSATLVVAPEGIMLNYLSRRVNPTPYVTMMPVEVMMFGEQTILAAYQQHPPDYLVLTDEDMYDYGFKYLSDSAPILFQWLHSQYHIVGETPVLGSTFLHALLLAHNETDEN
jgi:4-amino-4-deoxy-L-arabinose transferase-like glycosyltransferase